MFGVGLVKTLRQPWRFQANDHGPDWKKRTTPRYHHQVFGQQRNSFPTVFYFIFLIFIFIIFIWLHWVLVAAWGTSIFISACRIFSCGMLTLSSGMWDLGTTWPGIEPWPPPLGARSPSHWTTREVPDYTLLKFGRNLILNPCCREEANSDSMLELFLWLASRCFCYYNHTEWFASENPALLPDC